MKVTRLKLTNVRVMESAEFRFRSGFNLVVGVNGVGKTTVIRALAVCLSEIVKHTNKLRMQTESLDADTIRIGADSLDVECEYQIDGIQHSYRIHKTREGSVPETETGKPREQVIATPDREEFAKVLEIRDTLSLGDEVASFVQDIGSNPTTGKKTAGQPLAILFSTNRAVPSDRKPSKIAAAGGVTAAYADGFSHRELRLGEFAAWMRVQQALSSERPSVKRILTFLEDAVKRFLPGYENLHLDEADDRILLIDRSTATLPVRQLSAGKRDLLALALDHARRPSQANPDMDNPTAEAAGGVTAVYADGFSHRELRLGEFAAWMRVQQALSSERPSVKRTLAFLEDAVKRFLPGYENLHLNEEDDRILLIDRSTATLPVRQLSDGERGLLALVLDLARRLSQANPELDDPVTEAEAVVLIDEIDLHLHPSWQRQVVHNLVDTFPKCQFIATTHSPQIIGEVKSDHIHIIVDGQVYSPTHSFGVDSSRVLEEIMGTDPRTQNVHNLLTRIGHEIDEDRFDPARCSLSSLIEILGENDPEVVRLQTLLDFMEGNE